MLKNWNSLMICERPLAFIGDANLANIDHECFSVVTGMLPHFGRVLVEVNIQKTQARSVFMENTKMVLLHVFVETPKRRKIRTLR